MAAGERVLGEWGQVDVLVNNAVHTGPGSMERFLDLDIDMVAAKLEANVVAQLVLIKSVLPGMLERGGGHHHRHHLRRGDERSPRTDG